MLCDFLLACVVGVAERDGRNLPQLQRQKMFEAGDSLESLSNARFGLDAAIARRVSRLVSLMV